MPLPGVIKKLNTPVALSSDSSYTSSNLQKITANDYILKNFSSWKLPSK